jgi:hypothetical protein
MALPRATKDTLLGGSDLVEREVDLESAGLSVTIRSLPAAYSNEALVEATEVSIDANGEQTMRLIPSKLQVLQVRHGLVDPKLSIEEIEEFARKYGPAWHKLIEEIDAISSINGKAVAETNTLFRAGGQEEESAKAEVDATRAGDDGSDIPVRVGVGVGDVGE